MLLAVSFLWLEGCSTSLASWLFEKGLVKDDYRYGDLYRLANLKDFRVTKELCSTPKMPQNNNIHLVLAGDSFTDQGRIDSSHFVAKDFSYIRIDGQTALVLDTSQYNVLVLETVERHFRERFVSSSWDGISFSQQSDEKPGWKDYFKKIVAFELPYSNELHEGLLFGYDFTMDVREWKAALNYHLFERVDSHVKLNKSEEHLLYYLPSERGMSSAFDEISDAEIEALVVHVNKTQLKYRGLGFDKVILSIIPNKTSILGTDLGTYNELATRIQNSKQLEIPVLNANRILKGLGEDAYEKGDTHWTCQGKQQWVVGINELLVQDVKDDLTQL
ncbi:MAG: hypothetical protein ACI97P_000550 [Arcticibacterium sp.]